MNLMLDVETLGTSPRAALLQVGAVAFDPLGDIQRPKRAVQVNVDLDDAMANGGEVNGSTFIWWLKQSEEARSSICAPGATNVETAMRVLDVFWKENACEAVWAHGSVFDVPIVEHYMRRVGVKVPWRYSQIRDTRTLFAMAENLGWTRTSKVVAHTAAADAEAQASDVQAAWKWIYDSGEKPAAPS